MQMSGLLEGRHPNLTPTCLSSFIEPGLPHNHQENQYIITKIPLLQKSTISQYAFRSNLRHPHVPIIILENKSKFYLTLYAQKKAPFSMKDISKLSLEKRITILIDILKAISFLASHYGFFYVTLQMLGYNLEGKISFWIHEDILQNNRMYPIDQGLLSQEVFIFHFKQSFGSYFRELNEFYHTRTIKSLLDHLSHKNQIHQSLYLADTPKIPLSSRNSFITQNGHHPLASVLQWKESIIVKNPQKKTLCFSKPSLKHSISMNGSQRRERLMSQLTVQQSIIIFDNEVKKMMRTVSSPFVRNRSDCRYSEQPLRFPLTSPRNLAYRLSCSNVSFVCQSTTPKIAFNYEFSPSAWKKKVTQVPLKLSVEVINPKLLPIVQTSNYFSKQHVPEPMKVSFPHTTTHTFTPFSSNGNISLNFNESTNLQKKGMTLSKEEQHQSCLDQHISEQSNEVEMELDCLFSQSQSRQDDIPNVEGLAEELETLLLD